jgi:hypothetical protein
MSAMTIEERQMLERFQSELADLVDRYLRENVPIDELEAILSGEANSNLEIRKAEIDLDPRTPEYGVGGA